MSHRNIGKLVIFIALLFVSACVSFTSKLEPDTRLNPKMGYIYGRLTQSHTTYSNVKGGHLRMGLLIQEKEGAKTYKAQFEQSNVVSVIAVEPGVYKLTKILCAGWDYGPIGETDIKDNRLTKEFRVDAGKAYYVGDLHGITISQSIVGGATVTIYQSWKLDTFRNNYQDTTRDLTTNFPRFQGIHTVLAIN